MQITDNVRIKLLDALGHLSRSLAALSQRAFCPTGPGGGVDPSCGSGGGGNSSKPLSALTQSSPKETIAKLAEYGIKASKNSGRRKDVVVPSMPKKDAVSRLKKKGFRVNPEGDGEGTTAVRLDKGKTTFLVNDHLKKLVTGHSVVDYDACDIALYSGS